eukprot:TRINITY_DN14492_c0_g1_i1.p1 TRINITY_DN14492_c0_g1~~TRINITY_DN14492_c0_g1_i1.p1  ORF type:complete len:426 (+),score=82.77 TRINITY_DN14492_c0_g1_i1:68-1345(+)
MSRTSLKRERDEKPDVSEDSKRVKMELEENGSSSEVSEAQLLDYLESWPSSPVRIRDGKARDEEDAGVLKWTVISNDGSRESLKLLSQLKNVISIQLPKMPKVYIARLVFDFGHRSLIAVKDSQVIGGITFRPFLKEGMTPFIEVVFCVITKPEQRGGYGSRLMNQLKAWSQQNKFMHLLTYADDTAIGYFQRQGFSCEIGMETTEWDIGFLKYYDSATLMHCRIDTSIDYLNITHSLRLQRARYVKKLHELCSQHIVHPGITLAPGQVHHDMSKIPGLLECGWDTENYDKLTSKMNQAQITEENRRLLDTIKADTALSEAFKLPVIELHPELAALYLLRISDPIDLRTISEKLDAGHYITPEMMLADLHRMLENCKKFLKSLFVDNKQKNVEKDQLYESANMINTRYLTKRKQELGLVLNSQHD